ncbi:protein FAM219A-like isoform X7 [Columba livia]|uniref:protein FAM219A-like isoform X7 n=1 Tax=Columba livia TaxID=8932 RepID=UPI0031BBA387
MMEEIDRFQVPAVRAEMQPLDPTAASILDRDCDTREGETIAMNYKPSPLQVKLEKQRELARKGSLKNGNMGSPVNQQPKKNNVMARTRLVVPNKGYSSLDQSPDEKPLVALDTDSDDDFDMSRYSSSGYSSAEVEHKPLQEDRRSPEKQVHHPPQVCLIVLFYLVALVKRKDGLLLKLA